jgi:hypothetical protein
MLRADLSARAAWVGGVTAVKYKNQALAEIYPQPWRRLSTGNRAKGYPASLHAVFGLSTA